MDGIVVALIGAGASIIVEIFVFLGVVFTNKKSNEKINTDIQHKLETAQAVTDTKLDELTREVREHNGFARRMPVVEEQIKVINHRLRDLENGE
jgi:hypothetical protein